MRNSSFLFASLLALTGCTPSHVVPAGDAGPLSDAAPIDAALTPDGSTPDAAAPDAHVVSGCRLSTPDVEPTSVGEGCFCDGPFAVRGDVAYRLGYMLEVIDLADPDHPVLVTTHANEARYSADIHVVDDVLFTAGGPLERFDLTNPRAPVSLGVVDLGGESTALAVDGHRLVVSIRREDMTHAILSIDATDPRALVLGAPIETGEDEAFALALSGDTAFAVSHSATTVGSALTVYDLASGTRTDTFVLDGGSSLSAIVAHAGHLFLSHISDGVQLFDVTDPAAIVDLGTIALEATSVFSLDHTGDRLFVLGGGAWIYDMSNPRALVELGHADWSSDLGHAQLFGDNLLVSGGNALVSLPLTCP